MRRDILSLIVFVPALCLVSAGCSGVPSAQAQPGPRVDAVATFVVEVQETADEALKASEKVVRQITLDALRSIQSVRAVSDARIAFETGSRVIPEIGFNGMLVGPSRIKVIVDVSRPGWLDSLRVYLPSILAHELCHMVRTRHFISTIDPTATPPPGREAETEAVFKGWMRGRPPTLGDFVIHEGFADHFAMEVTGSGPYPSDKALAREQLERWTNHVLEHWEEPDYDLAAWVGGSDEVPRQAAYAVGYRLVADYLAARGGVRPSQLMLEPAAAFRPRR